MSLSLSTVIVATVIVAAALSVAAMAGCSSLATQTWRELYSNAPLEFTAPADSSDAVWERARSWFGGPLRPSLEEAGDTLLRSVQTRAGAGHYRLSVVREGAGDSKVRFVVSYEVSQSDPNDIAADRARDRAEELAYMAATSDTPQAHLQRRSRNEADPVGDWRHP